MKKLPINNVEPVARKDGGYTLRATTKDGSKLFLSTCQARDKALLNKAANRIRDRGFVHEGTNWVAA